MLEKLVTASRSDVGRSRSENQDAWREASNALGERLLVLADGMGGHRGGGEASRMCVQTIEARFLEQHDPVEVRLRRGIEEANSDILRRGLEDSELSGMGATCVVLVLCPDGQAWVAWAGDSRLYRLRAGKLEQLTEDHSLVGEWQKLGVLTPAQAASHPKRNELTRAIGVTREVEPEIRPLELRAGDRYLLCSDGLSGPVDEATLAQVLGAREPETAARALIDAANSRGGPDNVTVQIAWLPDDSPQALAEPAAPEPDPVPEPRLELGPIAAETGPGPRTSLELPVRPPPLAPLVPRAPARVASGRSAAAARPARLRALPVLRPHMPSLVGGVAIGLLLAAAAAAYLRWQADEPVPVPSAPIPAPAAPIPEPTAGPVAEPPPAPRAASPPAPGPRGSTAPRPAPAPAAPAAEPAPSFVIVGEVPETGAVRWVPVPEPVPTSAEFQLPEPVHAFLDAWLAALTADDAAAYASLGFRTGAAEFARTQASRESFRLTQVEIAPRSSPAQTYLRVVLSYAFQNGSGRFRTEDELRLILEPAAGGLHFSGYWQE
jgi:protein phosphatase